MRDSRSPARPEPTARVTDGLSRRGWIALVASTVAVAAVLVGVAAFAIASPAGSARVGASAAPRTKSPLIPELQPRPAPLGVPPRPTPTPLASGPAQPVDSLAAGDCLPLYSSPWEDAYPVVDCAAPHIAQLLHRGTLPEPASSPFPGTKALETQVTDLCGAPSILDWDWVAVWNEDVQIDLRYPRTAEQWSSGARSYYCFIYTYSRHELTGSAVAGQ
ncbi:hypothetical protein [Leifsonia sp. LS-T14]|uniref:hypothetical protein n=1 Tax=unclassified Leifsonia TaxID=2663824 RepID=UPI0035A6501C